LGWNFLEKLHTVLSRVRLKKGMLLTHRLFSYSPSFLFLDKKYSTRFYLRKKFTNIFIIGFENNQECELHLSKKTEPL